jgi:LacI family transcriptional regulator
VSPKLTTVSVPFYEMGRKAAMKLLAEESEEGNTILPVQLVKRETT